MSRAWVAELGDSYRGREGFIPGVDAGADLGITAETDSLVLKGLDRFRVLGRTTMVGRTDAGSVISEEGQEIATQMERNNQSIKQEKGE